MCSFVVQAHPGSTKQSESGQFFAPKLTTPGLVIRIGFSLIEDLGFATIEGLKAVPKRGLEIGGILLGRFDAAHSTILIEDHEPVEAEHLHGPSWLLSPKDRSVFRRTLDRLRDSPGQLRPVGFYRSQTRDGLSFDNQDNDLIREMFIGEPAVCMLVKPSLAEPSVAQLGVVTGNLLQPVAVFPFHAGILRERDFRIVEDSLPAIGDSSPVAENSSPVVESSSPVIGDSSPVAEDSSPIAEDLSPTTIPEEPSPPAQPVLVPALQRRQRIPRTATLVAIAAAILVCAFLVARYRTPHLPAPVPPSTAATPPPVTKPPVANIPATHNAVLLNVQRQNRTALLTWNRDAPGVAGADYALLLISDGRHREQLRLSKTDLEAGRVVYLPRSREISFQLRLFGQSDSTTESVRSVADLAPPKMPATDSRAVPHPLSATVNEARGDELEPTPKPTVTIYNNSGTAPATPPAVSQPPAQTTQAPAPAQPAPPAIATAPPQVPKPTPFAEADKTPPKPREPDVVTTVSLELIGHSGIREVFDNLSPRRIFGFGNDKTTPPRIVRQVLPGIYPAMASRIHGTREIDVKITIGVGGQVIKTEFPDGHAADPIDSAVYYAARQWTFAPARVDNRPVESKVMMHFVLKRSS